MADCAGEFYLDLCDIGWNVIQIDAEGWRVTNDPPVRFYRRRGMEALPMLIAGGAIDRLRKYINVKYDADFHLVVAWLVAALRGHGPYPLLNVTGEPGSAKSTLLDIFSGILLTQTKRPCVHRRGTSAIYSSRRSTRTCSLTTICRHCRIGCRTRSRACRLEPVCDTPIVQG